MDKLYINGELADLDDNRAAINFQTWSLFSLDSRHSPYSFGLKLPDTPLNRRLLGVPLMGSLTDIPYTKTPAMYEAQGVFIVGTGGYLIVERINEAGEFECTIYAESAEFWAILKDKKLEDLTTLGNSNWLLVDLIASGEWNKWAVIDWNEEQPNADFDDSPVDTAKCIQIDFMRQYPGLFLKTLITTIFTENGYTIANAGLGAWVDAKFSRMYMPCITQKYSATSRLQMAMAEATRSSVDNIATVINAQTYWYFDKPSFVVNYQNILYADVDPAGVQSLVLYYNVRSKGYYGFHVTLDIEVDAGVPGTQQELDFEVWNPTTGVALFGEKLLIDDAYGTYTLDINRSGCYVDTVGILCVRIYDASWPFARYFNVSDGTFDCTTAEAEYTAYGYDFEVAKNLPDMTQADVIKMWLNMRGNILWVDEEAKKVYVYHFKDLYTNTSFSFVPEDWSDYFDTIVELMYHLEGFAQVNDLIYDNDSTVWEYEGKKEALITDEALPENVELIKLPVSATTDVVHGNEELAVGGLKVANIKLRKAAVVENSINPRVLLCDLIEPATAGKVIYVHDTVTDITKTELYFCKFEGMDWNTLYLDMYTEMFTRMFDNAKIVRANFILPARIVKAHKANIPVYVKQLKGMFYVDIIENYTAGESCTVQLIRL